MIITDLCAAACGTLDRPVHKDSQGKIRGAAFPMKPTALLMRGILPFSAKPPRCDGTSCRMKVPGTRSHGILVQNRSPQAQGRNKQGGKLTKCGRKQTRTSDVYFRQTKVPHGYNSMLPLGLFKWMWNELKKWLQMEGGPSYWCHICSEGGTLQKCSRIGCPAVQHAECSTGKTGTKYWRCDDGLLRRHQHKSIQVQADKLCGHRQC